MAECSKCNIGVGCSCNLTNGLCNKCYSASRESGKVTSSKPCSLTIPRLNTLLNQLTQKTRTKIITYQIAIVKSQISQFAKDPCKFESIISNIQL
jgi:hypothetical protein